MRDIRRFNKRANYDLPDSAAANPVAGLAFFEGKLRSTMVGLYETACFYRLQSLVASPKSSTAWVPCVR